MCFRVRRSVATVIRITIEIIVIKVSVLRQINVPRRINSIFLLEKLVSPVPPAYISVVRELFLQVNKELLSDHV